MLVFLLLEIGHVRCVNRLTEKFDVVQLCRVLVTLVVLDKNLEYGEPRAPPKYIKRYHDVVYSLELDEAKLEGGCVSLEICPGEVKLHHHIFLETVHLKNQHSLPLELPMPTRPHQSPC